MVTDIVRVTVMVTDIGRGIVIVMVMVIVIVMVIEV
jgi:hypothetical protein